MSYTMIGYESLHSEDIMIGHEVGCYAITSSTPWPITAYLPDAAPGTFWHCAYCGQSNAAEREGCRGCRAPKPEVT